MRARRGTERERQKTERELKNQPLRMGRHWDWRKGLIWRRGEEEEEVIIGFLILRIKVLGRGRIGILGFRSGGGDGRRSMAGKKKKKTR